MKTLLTATLLPLFACADSSEHTISSSTRQALAALDIADVDVTRDGYDVFRDDGELAGSLRFDSNSGMTSKLDGATLSTRVTDAGLDVACNGARLSLSGDRGALAHPELLASCQGAATMAGLLVSSTLPDLEPQAHQLVACDIHILEGCINWSEAQGCIDYQTCLVNTCNGGYICDVNEWPPYLP